MKKLFLLVIPFLLLACGENSTEQSFAQQVEAAHHKQDFLSHSSIQFDFKLIFGGAERIVGKMILLTNSSAGLLEKKDGTKIMFNQNKVYYLSDNLENVDKIRFDAYTWSYFFLMPFKLTDDGTVWNDYQNKNLNGTKYLTEKLTFTSGTGDAPDDWYIVYADAETKLVKVAAYIVTANKSQEEAEKNPHAIEYYSYQEINGIPIATRWNFWEWRENIGLTNKIGSAEISNIEFIELTEDFFTPTNDFIEI